MSESNRLLEPQQAAPPYRKPFALPPHWYHDVSVYEAEAIAVYRNNWLCAGHQSELNNIGDFVRLDFCDESILVVRGRDNVLRAFYNVCQHRGHILVNERRGNLSGVIRCPYHSWGYELNGSLRHVPNLQKVPNFPVQDICLPEVTVSEYGSFVWVNLNPEASPIAREMSGLDAAIRQYIPDVETAIFFEGNHNTLPINWKTQVDNAIDTYHFQFSGPAHRQLTNSMQFASFERETHGKWLVEWGLPAPVSNNAGYDFDSSNARHDVDGFTIIWVYPDLQIVAMPASKTFMTYRTPPFGPEKTGLDYAYSGAVEAKGSDTSRAAIDWMNGPLSDEDNDLTTAVHLGHKSHGFTGSKFLIDEEESRYSEHPGEAFHKMLHEQVAPQLDK
jgi:carnitine monooxygenase subunit